MKAIRYNVPSKGDTETFGDSDNFTLHTNGVTVYFDTINETGAGYVFLKDGTQTAFVPEDECFVAPTTAQKVAKNTPQEEAPFSDN